MDPQQSAVIELLERFRKTVGVQSAVIVYGTGFDHRLASIGASRSQVAFMLREQAALVEAGGGEWGHYGPAPSASDSIDRPPMLRFEDACREISSESAVKRAIRFLSGGS